MTFSLCEIAAFSGSDIVSFESAIFYGKPKSDMIFAKQLAKQNRSVGISLGEAEYHSRLREYRWG